MRNIYISVLVAILGFSLVSCGAASSSKNDKSSVTESQTQLTSKEVSDEEPATFEFRRWDCSATCSIRYRDGKVAYETLAWYELAHSQSEARTKLNIVLRDMCNDFCTQIYDATYCRLGALSCY